MIPVWRIGADTPTPDSLALPTVMGLGLWMLVVGWGGGGVVRLGGAADTLLTSGVSSLQDRRWLTKTKATCVRAQQSESLAVIHTRAPPSSDSSNGTCLISPPE